jgi:hypothetical protein
MKQRTAIIPTSTDAPILDFGLLPGGLHMASAGTLSEVTTGTMDVRQMG